MNYIICSMYNLKMICNRNGQVRKADNKYCNIVYDLKEKRKEIKNSSDCEI